MLVISNWHVSIHFILSTYALWNRYSKVTLFFFPKIYCQQKLMWKVVKTVEGMIFNGPKWSTDPKHCFDRWLRVTGLAGITTDRACFIFYRKICHRWSFACDVSCADCFSTTHLTVTKIEVLETKQLSKVDRSSSAQHQVSFISWRQYFMTQTGILLMFWYRVIYYWRSLHMPS